MIAFKQFLDEENTIDLINSSQEDIQRFVTNAQEYDGDQFNYDNFDANQDYFKKYEMYLKYDVSYINRLFGECIVNKSNMKLNVLLLGCGHLAEVYSFIETYDECGFEFPLNILVMDKILWPVNFLRDIRELVLEKKKNINVFFKKTDFIIELLNNSYDYFNIMYFSRCINYLDYKRCNYEIKIEEYYKYLEKIIKKNNAVFGFSQVVKTDIYNDFALENEKDFLQILKCYKPIIFQGLTQVRNISYYTEDLNFYLYLIDNR